MKKIVVMGMALCTALAFSSCKSSESAYKKAYEKAKQQELAEASAATEAPVEAPAVETAPAPAPVVSTAPVREEKVELVSGDGLKAYSVVCGSFGVKANADGLKSKLDGDGYNAKVVYNAERNMYRVVVESFDTRDEAARARDAFKAIYPTLYFHSHQTAVLPAIFVMPPYLAKLFHIYLQKFAYYPLAESFPQPHYSYPCTKQYQS